MTIPDVMIKTPDRKCDWGVNDVMPGSDGLRILVELRFEDGWGESSFWATGCACVCWVSKLRFWIWAESPALEIWGMWSTPLLPLLPGPLWPRLLAPNRVLSIGQIKQTMCKQMTDVKLWQFYCNTWHHLTVCKKRLV